MLLAPGPLNLIFYLQCFQFSSLFFLAIQITKFTYPAPSLFPRTIHPVKAGLAGDTLSVFLPQFYTINPLRARF